MFKVVSWKHFPSNEWEVSLNQSLTSSSMQGFIQKRTSTPAKSLPCTHLPCWWLHGRESTVDWASRLLNIRTPTPRWSRMLHKGHSSSHTLKRTDREIYVCIRHILHSVSTVNRLTLQNLSHLVRRLFATQTLISQLWAKAGRAKKGHCTDKR